MHQELSKDGEDHKLGDVKTTPLDQHTLGCFLMSINLQVFYQELSFIHVLMLTITLLYLRWIG